MSRPALYRLPVARGNTAAGIYLGAIGAVAGIVFASIWMTTQITAYPLHFHPALGAPLVTIIAFPYRELLGPAAILVATLGVGGLMIPAWRTAAGALFMLAVGLLALRVGPLYAPLNLLHLVVAVRRRPGHPPRVVPRAGGCAFMAITPPPAHHDAARAAS